MNRTNRKHRCRFTWKGKDDPAKAAPRRCARKARTSDGFCCHEHGEMALKGGPLWVRGLPTTPTRLLSVSRSEARRREAMPGFVAALRRAVAGKKAGGEVQRALHDAITASGVADKTLLRRAIGEVLGR